MQPTIVYSHGFGVRKDDRGLFTDIAAILPQYRHVQFDYNVVDSVHNTLVVAPLTTQAQKLRAILGEQRAFHPDRPISLICHSQGCVVAGLAKPKNIEKIILLAPPAQMLGLNKKDMFKSRPGTREDETGTVWYPRRDGSTTIIKQDYWKSREGIKPIDLYNELAQHTDLTVIVAEDDEVLTNTDYSALAKSINFLSLPASHDFTDSGRDLLISVLRKIL